MTQPVLVHNLMPQNGHLSISSNNNIIIFPYFWEHGIILLSDKATLETLKINRVRRSLRELFVKLLLKLSFFIFKIKMNLEHYAELVFMFYHDIKEQRPSEK